MHYTKTWTLFKTQNVMILLEKEVNLMLTFSKICILKIFETYDVLQIHSWNMIYLVYVTSSSKYNYAISSFYIHYPYLLTVLLIEIQIDNFLNPISPW